MDIVLVGQPNVGKSLIFQKLTGYESIVSNYGGTSLESVRSRYMTISGVEYDIVDTPGIYSMAIAEGPAALTRDTILGRETSMIIDIIDSNHLARGVALTLELFALNIPIIVVLNQSDLAFQNGIAIDHEKLSLILGCPVISLSASSRDGFEDLERTILDILEEKVKQKLPERIVFYESHQTAGCNGDCLKCKLDLETATCSEEKVLEMYKRGRGIAERVTLRTNRPPGHLEAVEKFFDTNVLGTPALLLLALAAFAFLVAFVGLVEGFVGRSLAPLQDLISRGISAVVPQGFWNGVLSHGIPEGLIIPFTLVMPAMLMVSLLMALMEDVGLLPRYAVMLERVGRVFGVSGQAVIPLSLGFGCRTPAVAATRILPNWEQRFIIVTLLSIVVPCAGTIGMLTSAIVALKAYTWVVFGSMVTVFLVLGWILKKIYGNEEEPVFELPPFRLPEPRNIWVKIKVRFNGLFSEVLPLLLVMSVGVRILIDSGVLVRLDRFGSISHVLFGIPPEAVAAVLVTIVQRYLAPLIIINLSLSPREATIAIAMIAMSVPCLPVMVMTVRELGSKALIKILGMGLTVSFLVGIILNLILPA